MEDLFDRNLYNLAYWDMFKRYAQQDKLSDFIEFHNGKSSHELYANLLLSNSKVYLKLRYTKIICSLFLDEFHAKALDLLDDVHDIYSSDKPNNLDLLNAVIGSEYKLDIVDDEYRLVATLETRFRNVEHRFKQYDWFIQNIRNFNILTTLTQYSPICKTNNKKDNLLYKTQKDKNDEHQIICSWPPNLTNPADDQIPF